jgi:hypothetical protein
MPLNYNLEDEDEFTPREEVSYEEEIPSPMMHPPMPPTKGEALPNVPRDPDDPNEKLKNYFKRQDEMAQQRLRGGRQDAEMYRRSNSEIGLGQLLNQSANQFGSLGGKAASSAPLDQFSQGLKQSNLQELQLAGNERKAAGDSEDRKLKMMEYMQRQGFQAANMKRQQGNIDRSYELAKNKQEWGRLHPKGTGEEDGGELLTGIPKRLWNKATDERKKLDEHSKVAKDIRQNLEEMAGIGGKEGYIPGWLGGKAAQYDTLKANVSAAIVGKVAGIRSDKDYENIVVPMLPVPGSTPVDAKRKVDIFMNWLQSQAPEAPVLNNYGKNIKAPVEETPPAPPPTAPGSGQKPLHQMTREEKLKELEELGGG